jgi:type II secretory ATPase GspE/PulE/Tfp pilus assembly ATPase PilB-like protein
VLGRSAGMVLVTGPTGSGKTTTLYAALAEINAEPNSRVITVEDPIEYRLPGLTQVQVNDKIELTFARVLRAVLRQDPDVHARRRDARCRNSRNRHHAPPSPGTWCCPPCTRVMP